MATKTAEFLAGQYLQGGAHAPTLREIEKRAQKERFERTVSQLSFNIPGLKFVVSLGLIFFTAFVDQED